ncbi:MAG: regulatory protein RecX [Bacteroidales bacterium]
MEEKKIGEIMEEKFVKNANKVSRDLKRDLRYFMSICSRREYCEQDILKKCLKRKISEKDSAEILSLLKKDKFVDNQRYSTSYTRDKTLITGWGPIKIRYALKIKAISDDNINDALDNLDVDDKIRADKRLSDILLRKWKSYRGEENNYIKKQKLIKFAANRGYSYSQIKFILDNLQ